MSVFDDVVRRLRAAAPESVGTVIPAATPVVKASPGRKVYVRYQTPDAESVWAAGRATTEVPFEENYFRQQRGARLARQAEDAERTAKLPDNHPAKVKPLTAQEQAWVDTAPGDYPDLLMRQEGLTGRNEFMTGAQADAMSRSMPGSNRWTDRFYDNLDFGDVAQRSVSLETQGLPTINSPRRTLEDVYVAQAEKDATVWAPSHVHDVPDELVGLSPERIAQRLSDQGTDFTVDTRLIPERAKDWSPGNYGYGYDESPYQRLGAGTLADRANATGHPMDEYLAGLDSGEQPLSKAQLYTEMILQGKRPPIPFGSAITYADAPTEQMKPTLDVIRGLPLRQTEEPLAEFKLQLPLDAQDSTVGTLGSAELSRRLRNANPEVYQTLVQQRAIPRAANPVQVDFRAVGDKNRKTTDALARLRGRQLDQDMAEQALVNQRGSTVNYNFEGTNPDEYYLYGSQSAAQGNLPEEVAGLSQTYDYAPSQSLVRVGMDSRNVNPIVLGANRVGLGVDINRGDTYSTAAVRRTLPVRGADDSLQQFFRNIPVDPIHPLDAERPGMFFAEKLGLDASTTPEIAIADDRKAATRLRALANIKERQVNKALGGDIPYKGVYTEGPNQGKPLMYKLPDGRLVEGWALQSPDANLSETVLDQLQTGQLGADARRAADTRVLADKYNASARNMEAAMNVVKEQTAPQNQIILHTVRDAGTSQAARTSEEMDLADALRRLKESNQEGQLEAIFRMPHVPTPEPAKQKHAAKQLYLPHVYGHELSASIMSDPNVELYKAIARVDPELQPNQVRRGVQWKKIPKSTPDGRTTADFTVELVNPGRPVIDPATGQRMMWNEQPIITYNPLVDAPGVAEPEVRVGTRYRPSRSQVKAETYQQYADAINEGYVPKTATDPTTQVVMTGDDLSNMRGGISAEEAKAAAQHNTVRRLLGLPAKDPAELSNTSKLTGVPLSEVSAQLIKRGRGTQGIEDLSDAIYDQSRTMSNQVDQGQGFSSGPIIAVRGGSMLNEAMTTPRPVLRQRPAPPKLRNQY